MAAEPFEGAKSEDVVDALVEEAPEGFPNPPKILFDGAFDWPSGLLKLNKEPLPAPILAPGGGPAGVVELPNSDVVCLLVGVVLTSFESALAPNRPPPPGVPPKGFDAGWEAAGVSAGLLGVERIDAEGALVASGPACETG